MQRTIEHLDYPKKTMYELLQENASRYAEEPAYEFYGKRTSYRQFLGKIDQAAAAFTQAGIGKGDVVMICLPNVPQSLAAFYALDKIGAVANMVHPASAQAEVTFYLKLSKSKMVLALDVFCEKIRAACDEVEEDVQLLICRIQDELPTHLRAPYMMATGRKYRHVPAPGQGVCWTEFLKQGESLISPTMPFDDRRTSVILYSGGTSGIPKGICLSDFNMNALAFQCASQVSIPLRPGLKMLSCMPMFHGFGLGVNIHTALAHGVECILMPVFNLKAYAGILKKKRPNFIAGVPTIYEALLHIHQLDDVKLDFLYGVFCGGDSLTVELKKKVDRFLKEHGAAIEIQEGYGLTECVTASCLTPLGKSKEGSIGLPFPDTYYAIVSPGTDDELSAGEEGEIILRGPTVMLGYLDQPEETAATLRRLSDGNLWLYTGDLGHMDEEGFVYFKQRIKRMIITNGYNVYPGQVENVIDSVPDVAYSCVIGVPDERRGQIVRAYVVPRDGVKKTDALRRQIEDALELQIAAYAKPREICFRRELPKTLVGKVAYRLLEEEAEAELLETVAMGRAAGDETRRGEGDGE